jgi:HPt (histidine-containing phosphotransfer) domain-containing protein
MSESVEPFRFSLQPFIDAFVGPDEVCVQILDIFMKEAPERISGIEAARETSDWETVERLSHSLANITGTLKCPTALESARAVERQVRAGETANIGRDLDSLISEVEEMLRVTKEYRSGF